MLKSEEFENDEESNIADLKTLKKLIINLHKNEHIEIFKIIKEDTDKYTENRNGIFINMSKLKLSTIQKIRNFVDFCIENKKNLKDNVQKMETIKNLVTDKNDNIFLSEEESIESTDSESKENEKFEYQKNQKEIILNEIDDKLLKDSIDFKIKDKILNKKKKLSGVKGRIIKKCRDSCTNINQTKHNI